MSDLSDYTQVKVWSALPRLLDKIEAVAPASSARDSDRHMQDDTGERRRRALSGDIPVGPPPSFEANVLEVEHDLKALLARSEAERARPRDLAAVAPETRTGNVAPQKATDLQTPYDPPPLQGTLESPP